MKNQFQTANRQKALLSCWIFLFLLLSYKDAFASSERYALILGNNRGHRGSELLHYSEEDAKKFQAVLVERGDFRPENISLILGGTAEQAWAALRKLNHRIKRESRSGSSLLIVYYSGHANGNVLEFGDTSFDFREFRDALENSSASVRLAIVDSCQSGNLVANKGAKRAPGFDISVQNKLESKGYAIVTSSSQNELSQESAEIRGSFFTHFLVSGLRGAADESGDAEVTLGEAYLYTYSRTVARTTREVGISHQHPMYEYALKGKGDVVLTTLKSAGSMITIAPEKNSRIVVLDALRDRAVAETSAKGGTPARIALYPGEYQVFSIDEKSARAARVSVVSGQNRTISQADFQTVKLSQPVAKGGLFRKRWIHNLAIAGLMRQFELGEDMQSYGGALTYRADAPSDVSFGLDLIGSTAPNKGYSRGYFDLGLLGGLGWRYTRKWFGFRPEGLIGYEHLVQDPEEGKRRQSSSLSYLARVNLEAELSDFVLVLGAGAGGRLYRARELGVQNSYVVLITLGIGWRFEV